MFRLFGREQVTYLAVIAAAAQVLMSYGFDVSRTFQAVATAIVVFVFAVGNAIVMHDGAVALATGVLNAGFALFAGLGLDWTTGHQTYIVGLATVLIGLFTRQQVVNPIPATVSPAGRLVDKAAA